MQKTLNLIRAFARDEDGVTAIEYALLAALISVMVIGGATTAGTSLNTMYAYIANKISDVAAGTGG
ncbi:Flp pilus assembly protein, pilin Flp [Paraburkholderia piptadeniae]|uniref:Flp pilus assembly protein, pilin Flp n=1 Tax=Paraburkholderia piptadeniae TaxID=1701573 RepID=A0A1N7SS51_9BURK|nr:Flp family type IVb pilin [Paraburkholderia piptadeniae]SIT50172.1 Flp pilus assembly protein, pilin Flp [Paraburkholderia piptadeniae]